MYTILVPLALDDDDRRPWLDFAVEEARLRGGRLILFHVVDYLPGALPVELPAGYPSLPVADFEATALEHLDELKGRIADLPVECAVEVGRAAKCVADLAKLRGVDQIVIGSHSRGKLARLVLGSVADRVARIAPCPVTIVRRD